MDENSDKNVVLMKELDDIITLAESSATSIDVLQARLGRVRMQMYLFGIVAYILCALIVAGLITLEKNIVKLDLFFAVAALFVVLIAFAIGSSFFIRNNQQRKFRRDLRVEHDIHEKLLSLIDEQTRRIQYNSSLSPVARATIDIRIRRLDRTDRKL